MKLKNLILEQDDDGVEDLFTTQRSPKERAQNKKAADLKRVKQYINKSGFKGNLDLTGTELKELPNELKQADGKLNLYNSKIEKLPDNLTVKGDLSLTDTKITSLPNNLKVEGSLFMRNTPITTLPSSLDVGNSIFLDKTKIKSLPDNFEVNGILDLENTPITSLPNNLKVRTTLEAHGTPINKLGDNITVGFALHIPNTRVDSIPNNLNVGFLHIQNTPLAKRFKYDANELKAAIEEKGGSVDDVNDIRIM